MPSKKINILLVEDDKFLQGMYTTKLENAGINITTAEDGQKALDLIRKNNFDIVLLDILIPKKDGFEVLQEIKQDKILKSIPVILLTNLSEVEDVKRAKNLGASEYLIKSHFLPSEVIGIVKKYIK